MSTQNSGLLSLADAARKLGLSEDVVLQLVGSKQLAAEIRIAPEDVEAYLTGHPKSGVVNEYSPSEVQKTP